MVLLEVLVLMTQLLSAVTLWFLFEFYWWCWCKMVEPGLMFMSLIQLARVAVDH